MPMVKNNGNTVFGVRIGLGCVSLHVFLQRRTWDQHTAMLLVAVV